ncbi:NACHT domain-containing protein [Vibrio vulnificus]|uniref:NACHT domain-containing protein n=1 Tax=Vibrio vulnificus TaxID=672 RepID=UPI001CDD6715|nr:NACHT domain-containing protein [Vibrio vulnificus]MCA3980483.1 NACHT domain-containing protein [Vibrio vulnificus]MCR9498498.1 NACHT domain-containing protein [Vibrio vulnificus]MCU8389070.1 NACHT domain-containing protein [Vibrio vulnificus]MCU8575773.1 NACHT domain-containing protein [Vibrio vulnificus]
MLLDKLISLDESESIEFKSYWYWNGLDKDTQKAWGELLKDFVSLINTKSREKTKYLIVGFNEITKEKNNYNYDRQGNKIENISDIVVFKNNLVNRLKRNFRAKCSDSYVDLKNIPIENYFTIKKEILDDVELLIISFKEIPFLLELDKQLPAQTAYKQGNVFIRKLKKDNTPENAIANVNDISLLVAECKKSNELIIREKEYTVSKLVDCFREVQSPKSVIHKHHSNENKYEHYTLSGGIIQNPIHLIYFNKYTSQTKAVQHISEKSLIKIQDQVFLITDNANRTGGDFNDNKLSRDFKNIGVSVEIYTIEKFSLDKIYNDAFEVDILHDGEFSIDDFITPQTINSDKNADLLISEWMELDNSPLMILKGLGGIGKTTVVKHYLDGLYKQKKGDVNIIFVSSHDLINVLSKNDEVSDLYDFYKAFLDVENVSYILDKTVFELTIDHGNLIFVIDGIDEVLAKLGGKFDVNGLISSIFNNYTDTLAKAKVIFTCREEFWSIGEYEDQIYSLTLSPFTRELAEKYFEKKFEGNKNKISKALNLSEQFALNRETNEYVPYILDMVKENLLVDDQNLSFPKTALLIPELANDFLIGKVCDREIIKLGHKSIDEQVNLFIKIALTYDGKVPCHILMKNESVDVNDIEIYKAHPLLIYDSVSEYIIFRYDFFSDYFKMLYVFLVLSKKTDLSKLSTLDKITISQVLSIGVSAIDLIKKRIGDIDAFRNDLIDELYLFVGLASQDSTDRKLSSSIFFLILCTLENQTKDERTKLLKQVYSGASQGVIENLNLINFYSTRTFKSTFNFSDMVLKNCWIENHEAFGECDFSRDTKFYESTFIKPLFSNSCINFCRENFENDCNITDLEDKFSEIEELSLAKEYNYEKSIKKCLNYFWSNGRFKVKTVDFINKRMNKDPDILLKLLQVGVIEETKVTTNAKRLEKSYLISKKYKNDLSKIMDQNSSNSSLDFIVKKVVDIK